MKKFLVLVLMLNFLFGLSACQNKDNSQSIIKNQEKTEEAESPKASQDMTTREEAIKEAYRIYKIHKQEGEKFKNSPCLTNHLIKNWVLDIANKPRLDIDDLPENQCEAYLEGNVEHFVELTPKGKLIQAK